MKRNILVLMLMLLSVGSLALCVSGEAAQGNLPDRQNRLVSCAENLMAGTGKLNVAKSKFNPGPALKSGTLKIESQGTGIKCALDPMNAKGKARHAEWTAKYDGKDYPAGMVPFADTIALNWIDDYAVDAVYKRGGKEILNERRVRSRDRKTLTMAQVEGNSTGQGFNKTLVDDKQ
jgi:hypothetical protein